MLRPALIAGLAALLSAGAAAQDTTRWITPWQVYLACQGVQSLDPGAGVDSVQAARTRSLCGLTLPRIGTRFAGVERAQWTAALQGGSVPSDTTLRALVTQGERVLLDRVNALGRVSFGGANIQFGISDAVLQDDDRAQVRAMAERVHALVAADSNYVFEVIGFADRDSAGDAKNLDLARRRAQAVMAELRRNGVPEKNIGLVTRLVTVPNTASASLRQAARSVAMNPVPGGQGLGAPAPASTGQAGGLDMSSLLIGTADFLVREAREQVQAYVLERGGRRICGDAAWRALLPSTCALVPLSPTDTLAPDSRYFPGVAVIRDALREDLRALPYQVGRTALTRVVGDSTAGRIRERALLGVYLLNYVEELGQARNPLVALERAVPAFADSVVGRFRLDTLPVVRRIRQTAAVAGLLRSAREDLAAYWHPEVLADSAALYTLKSLALNVALRPGAGDSLGFRGGVAPYVDRALDAIRTGQTVLASLEEGWTRLRALRQDSSYAQARRDLLGGIAGDAVELAMLAFPDSAMGTRADSLRGLAVPVRELVTALTTNSPADALNSLLALARAVQDDGRILDGTQLRVLSFTTEIAQARQAGDVEAAFSRLVSDGPGYQGKRDGQGTYWRVNGYGGVAAGLEALTEAVEGGDRLGGSLGLTLPIGIEVGTRSRGRSTSGAFIQLLDLGAIASARVFNSSAVETFPEFGFGSVVAPGLFYARGLADKPFSLLYGVAYFPQARTLEGGSEVGALRATMSFAVDIPFFP